MDKFIMEKLRHHTEELQTLSIMERIPIHDFRISFQDDQTFATNDFEDQSWPVINKGESWGGRDTVIWLRNSICLPGHFRGQCVDLHLEPGPREGLGQSAEALLYLDGKPVHGLDNWHADVRLNEEEVQKEKLQLAMRCWAGMIPEGFIRHLGTMEIRRIHRPTEELYYICKILLEGAEELSENDWNRYTVIEAVDEIFKRIDCFCVGTEGFYESIGNALEFARKQVVALQFEEGNKPVVSVCGHSHIDMAWLWRIPHTREKGVRSFSTVLHLMDQYPEYKFSQSSPFLYEKIREKYPETFEKIKQKIAEGRWEITGAMWVEPDTNLSGGESLVRQILLGKTYMKQEFGVDCKTLWLPDVFGYCAALPQLLKKSGVDFFWTNKMSWNQYNRFPYDTFLWKSMDGSEVLTQLGTCPEKNVTWGSTYNGVIAQWEVKGVWDNYRQKDINRNLLMPFGWGDGGGGPTREMLEAYPIMKNLPGIPKVEMRTCEAYAEQLMESTKDKKLPVWDGEMYFEYHRGTYTSQGWIKRANRKAEYAIHDAELLLVLADLKDGKGQYPYERLQACWKMICTNQFHDILPGSSIHEVYEDARKDYEQIFEEEETMLKEAEARLAGSDSVTDGMMVFNTLSWKRDGVVVLPEEYVGKTLLCGEKKALCQSVSTLSGLRQLVYLKDLPSLGYTTLPFVSADSFRKEADFALNTLPVIETPFYRVRFNEIGQLKEIYDKRAERQVLKSGSLGNVLIALEDKPHQFDAWNTEIYAFEKTEILTDLKECRMVSQGPLQTVVQLKYEYHHSTVTQQIVFSNVEPQISFDTICDWKEHDTLLKACFDVEIRSKNAVFDVQFGNLERPTHDNTSWDYAQFEVCMHKWFDLSEDGYGVAVLNDCKYGCDVKNGLLRLTLLKSATYPDERADQGEHRFTYALLPHRGGWREGNVARTAYEFNLPVRTVACRPGEDRFSLAEIQESNVVIDAVKMAENGNGVIFRIYEYMCRREPVTMNFGRKIKDVRECDLLEKDLQVLNHDGQKLVLPFTPYEIKTIRVIFEDEK